MDDELNSLDSSVQLHFVDVERLISEVDTKAENGLQQVSNDLLDTSTELESVKNALNNLSVLTTNKFVDIDSSLDTINSSIEETNSVIAGHILDSSLKFDTVNNTINNLSVFVADKFDELDSSLVEVDSSINDIKIDIEDLKHVLGLDAVDSSVGILQKMQKVIDLLVSKAAWRDLSVAASQDSKNNNYYWHDLGFDNVQDDDIEDEL